MIVGFYAALLAVLYLVLSYRIIQLRHRFQIAIGAADHPELLRAMRVHGNFAEYVPFALLLLWMLQQTTFSLIGVHVLCILLLLGRCLHAYGVSQMNENFRFRVLGMQLTFAVMGLSALLLLYFSVVPNLIG